MTVFVTAISLFIYSEGQTFTLNWDKASSWGMNDDKMKLTAMLDNGKMVHWTTNNSEVWDEVKDAIHTNYTTVYMLQDNCHMKVEVIDDK